MSNTSINHGPIPPEKTLVRAPPPSPPPTAAENLEGKWGEDHFYIRPGFPHMYVGNGEKNISRIKNRDSHSVFFFICAATTDVSFFAVATMMMMMFVVVICSSLFILFQPQETRRYFERDRASRNSTKKAHL